MEAKGIDVTDKNTFLVLSAMTPTKKMEANEGLRFLQGKGKLDIPLKKKSDESVEKVAPKSKGSASVLTSPIQTEVTVSEGGRTRVFRVTVGPDSGGGSTGQGAPALAAEEEGTDVYSTFGGSVEVADILVSVGDTVASGQAVAKIEAMKATHDIKAPCDGVVSGIHVSIGDEIDSETPILTI
jgi:biotin carboxyl carrier protein